MELTELLQVVGVSLVLFGILLAYLAKRVTRDKLVGERTVSHSTEDYVFQDGRHYWALVFPVHFEMGKIELSFQAEGEPLDVYLHDYLPDPEGAYDVASYIHLMGNSGAVEHYLASGTYQLVFANKKPEVTTRFTFTLRRFLATQPLKTGWEIGLTAVTVGVVILLKGVLLP